MKRIRLISLVIAAIVFMFAYLNFQRMQGEDEGIRGVRSVSVVVAKQDIKQYTILMPDMLEMKEFLIKEGESIDMYFVSFSDVSQKVACADIYAGEFLTKKRVVASDDASIGMASRIEKGKRAMSVMVDTERGVGYNLNPGDYVDMMYSGEVKDASSDSTVEYSAGMFYTAMYGIENPSNTTVYDEMMGEVSSTTFLQNIKVLSVGTRETMANNGEKESYDFVTLEVTPEQARWIQLVKSDTGSIWLTLRSLDDHVIVSDPRSSLIQSYEAELESVDSVEEMTTTGEEMTQEETIQDAGVETSSQSSDGNQEKSVEALRRE